MKLSLRTFIPATAVGMTALLSACMNTEDRVKSYMIRANHSQMEYEKMLSNENERFIQSKLDSLAYRDVFNGTQAAKDSACVAEFNKIAADMRPASDFSESKAIEIIKKKLTERGISVKDFQSVTNQSSKKGIRIPSEVILQHYADDWAYRDFFRKNGIYSDKIAKECDEVSTILQP